MRMYRIVVNGIVQGVGFRPYVYRKAKEHNLVGSVRNTGNGVEIIVNDASFIYKLTDLPPLAKIMSHSLNVLNTGKRYTDFTILKSTLLELDCEEQTELPADMFLCDECLKELRNKNDRRHNYHFITCTNCGPRFSMIEGYPYDRINTSMNDFKMCKKCEKEYSNPHDRRYHAETIACKECGPKLSLLDRIVNINGNSDTETIKKTAALLKKGELVAIKGVGGFHISSSCRADAVMKVRELLHRPHKPFAIMARDMEMAESIAHATPFEKEMLASQKRPIVVLKKKARDYFLHVSELDTIGVMLPYTALHHLIFDHIDEPLVMTSCNVSGEPILIDEKSEINGKDEKTGFLRYFLTHERRIVNRCDDSVLKAAGNHALLLRRSRGYTPMSVRMPTECLDTVALGAEINNVISIATKNKCVLSQYIGDTSKLETLYFLKDCIEKSVKLARINPKIVACDMHPAYNTTHLAEELARKYGAKLERVQHHKAHVASAAAEQGLCDYIGIAMDGTGYGEDGKIWGGEVFDVSSGTEFKRAGHLEEQPMIGGDSSTIYPKKMLFGILSNFMDEDELLKYGLFDEKESRMYMNVLENGFNVISTTSSGRVLDAVSALIGLCDVRTYDGRPAMLLESVATKAPDFEPVLSKHNGTKILETTPLFEFLLDNLDRRRKGELAATAQMYLAKGLLMIAKNISEKEDKKIVFSGGVAYNRMISEFMTGNGVLMNKEIPAGDGGLCYGQAYLANACQD